MQKITPFLWFNGEAEEAMNFYCSIFKNSKVLNIIPHVEGNPNPKGAPLLVKFELEGQEFVGLNGNTMAPFSMAISLAVNCTNQQEIDELWEKLSTGGEKQICGWLKDKYGVSWQVIPNVIDEMMADATPEQLQSLVNAVEQMTKLDIATMQEAFNNPQILQH